MPSRPRPSCRASPISSNGRGAWAAFRTRDARMISRAALFWLGLLLLALVALWLLSGILAPFLVGFAVAYLLDPPTRRLQRAGLSRGASAGLVIAVFFIAAIAAI